MGLKEFRIDWIIQKKHNIYLDGNNNNNNFNDTIKNSSILQHLCLPKNVCVLPQFSSRLKILKPAKLEMKSTVAPLLR